MLLNTPIFAITSKKNITSPEKVIICGVCKNIEFAVENTIKNIEELGNQFKDYAVIIYENNSNDNTATLFSKWAEQNSHVVFISEMLPVKQLSKVREKNIARARNIVLSLAKDAKYNNFKYLVMVDLDFITPWPIDEIVNTTQIPGEWDCITANGLFKNGTLYYDRYAFRNNFFPFGLEIIGKIWWERLNQSWFNITQTDLMPVYSAFGGLGVYKRKSIINFTYSGTVTEDLRKYYKQILLSTPVSNSDLQKYLEINKKSYDESLGAPIIFKNPICCEHVPLHASMSLNGFSKIYVNPKMCMYY